MRQKRPLEFAAAAACKATRRLRSELAQASDKGKGEDARKTVESREAPDANSRAEEGAVCVGPSCPVDTNDTGGSWHCAQAAEAIDSHHRLLCLPALLTVSLVLPRHQRLPSAEEHSPWLSSTAHGGFLKPSAVSHAQKANRSTRQPCAPDRTLCCSLPHSVYLRA